MTRSSTLISQIKNRIRLQGKAVNFAQPFRIGATNNGPSHQRINIAIGQNNKARAQRGDEFRFPAGRRNRWRRKRLMVIPPSVCPSLACLSRLPARAERVMPVSNTAWPLFSSHCFSRPICVERPTPSVPSKTMRLALELVEIYIRGALRQRSQIEPSANPGFLGAGQGLGDDLLTSACCSSMERVASITTRPNSSTIFSYSSIIRP